MHLFGHNLDHDYYFELPREGERDTQSITRCSTAHHRLAALPKPRLDPRCRSNPIAHRVRRKRQRLPPSLLIENASIRYPAPPQQSAPRRFRSRLATIRPESSHRLQTAAGDYNAQRMALTSGTKLGPYEIQSPLGAGGMGEVYRARDTRLDRTVAVKILPAHLSSNPEARQRFEREARAISSLNHPNICTLHDVGHQDGIDFLVMEYLEGETLADRLAKGPLPPEQVLKYSIEICEGLQRAHKSGVVQR